MSHEDLQEAPLLILANKQDRQVMICIGYYDVAVCNHMLTVQDALPLTQLEATLDTNAGSIGGRDCKIQRVSALQGY